MAQIKTGKAQERREFFRLHFTKPLQYKAYAPQNKVSRSTAGKGVSQNISQSGILFETAQKPPQLSSIVWLNLDLRTLNICKEIEGRALIMHDGLMGRVVRVEESPKGDSTYDVGVCFLTQEQKNSKDIQQVLSELANS